MRSVLEESESGGFGSELLSGLERQGRRGKGWRRVGVSVKRSMRSSGLPFACSAACTSALPVRHGDPVAWDDMAGCA